ncbi:MerR family transcriptional regulator [Lelliottia amnigena]|uniref:MerR family transcriptional regulator n=1 Tax=Lelliottia amnigena TaxID=61646 RepID=A0AAP2F2B6_LELAM|nr:MerR family transcriptional regulator [Lelliottia amnigena]MBL5899781.1 MerR family transcriptional regulator [Lelliottia amnigena]MBL5919972.1 MerR family transcriptional regulator [Lelliottia amnigena]MBL5928993.1 MerR family transcriptional regulator [Lelliottia amnigena]MBL5935295.1 MerR family transcriptional regulator [Lelliottia amnigena]MBL5964999.1 MerR family transcriptional regulator [Lelliottia amnigena]
MAYYSIGEVAERCGINPVTLRAWQRRYGLLKPQRSEGGHRQFDEEDILRIEEIKRLMKSGVSVGKVKALLGTQELVTESSWTAYQEEMMLVLRYASPAKLRAKLADFRREHSVEALIDHILVPVRQRMSLDQNTVRHMASLLDGVLIEVAAASLVESRKKPGKDALLMGWECEDRTRLWLEAARLSHKGWHIDVLAEPIDSPRPELFPGQKIFVWTGKTATPRQQEQLDHWREQGFSVSFHEAGL